MLLFLRLGGVIVGLGLLGIGIVMSGAPRRELREFHRAPYCTASAGGADCIARSTGTVLGRRAWTETTTTGNPPNQSTSTETHYSVTVRTADGHKQTFEVGPGLYSAAHKGGPARLETWRGHVTRLAIGDAHEDIPPTMGVYYAWMVGWAGVALVVACVLAWEVPLFVFGFAFVGGIVLRAFLFWTSADWYVAPIVVVGVMVVWRARQMRR